MNLVQPRLARDLLEPPEENEGPSVIECGICRDDMEQLLYRFPTSRRVFKTDELFIRCDTYFDEKDLKHPVELYEYLNVEGVIIAREKMTASTVHPFEEHEYVRFAVRLHFPVLD